MSKPKIAAIVIIIVIAIGIGANLFSLGRLYFTDVNVTKAYFTPYYYVKVEGHTYETEVLKRYMTEQGWEFIGQEGAGFFFQKGDKTIHISGNDLKTVIKR